MKKAYFKINIYARLFIFKVIRRTVYTVTSYSFFRSPGTSAFSLFNALPNDI